MDESSAERSALRPVSAVALEEIKKRQQELLGRTLDPEEKAKLEQSQYNQALEWMSSIISDPSKYVYPSTEEPAAYVYPSTERPTSETFYYTWVEIGDKLHQVALMPSGNIIVMDVRTPTQLKADRPPLLESRGPLKFPKVNIVSHIPAGMEFSADAPDEVTIYEESFVGENHIGTKATVIKPEQTQKQIEEIAAAKVSLPRRAEPGK
jgi:hypothetical protein